MNLNSTRRMPSDIVCHIDRGWDGTDSLFIDFIKYDRPSGDLLIAQRDPENGRLVFVPRPRDIPRAPADTLLALNPWEVSAFLDAIQGAQSAPKEVSALQEALTLERSRVDRILAKSIGETA